MRIIGVLDLLAGRAVHAVAGQRSQYRPVERVAGSPIAPGDAVALARAYVRLGVAELYAADLDAIAGGAIQNAPVVALAGLGLPLWLDAGVSSVQRARQALDLGASRVIVGLETLSSYTALEAICRDLGSHRVAFSLDLREGELVASPTVVGRGEPAERVATRAVAAGAGAILVIDLGRVGTDRGIDFELISRVRASTAPIMLVSGGGVRGSEDLARLAACGCDGALVASALLDGRLHVDGLPHSASEGAGLAREPGA